MLQNPVLNIAYGKEKQKSVFDDRTRILTQLFFPPSLSRILELRKEREREREREKESENLVSVLPRLILTLLLFLSRSLFLFLSPSLFIKIKLIS